MSDITQERPCIEKYQLGLIDKNGKLNVLCGKQLITINCRESLIQQQCYNCGINCSCFSGPMSDIMPIKKGEEFDYIPVVKICLLCSGRTLYFGRFINLLALDKTDIDFSNSSTEEILNKVGVKI